MQRLYIFYKRLCTIKLYFVNFFFSFASFDPTLSLIILMLWIPQIRVSWMMHWPTMLVAPLCTIASLGLRLTKSSRILSVVKGLIITVAANSTPLRELPSPVHTTLSTLPPVKAYSPLVCFSWASGKRKSQRKNGSSRIWICLPFWIKIGKT